MVNSSVNEFPSVQFFCDATRLKKRAWFCVAMDGNRTSVLGCKGPHGNKVQHDIHVTPMGENDCHIF